MSPDERDAAQVLAAAPTRAFEGRVWRVHWREVSPTDASLSRNTTGRYHRGLDLHPAEDAFPALYTSTAPEIAVWEMVRRSAAQNLAYLRNNVLTELEVMLGVVLDLSDPAAAGLTREGLTGDRLEPCQEIAAGVVTAGYQGLLVPSAALPGSNLVIFPPNLPDPPPLRVIGSVPLPLEIARQGRTRR